MNLQQTSDNTRRPAPSYSNPDPHAIAILGQYNDSEHSSFRTSRLTRWQVFQSLRRVASIKE
jgi:hypothetical protein